MVHFQETERVPNGSAAASVALNGNQPEIFEGAGRIGKYNLLGRAFHWVSVGLSVMIF